LDFILSSNVWCLNLNRIQIQNMNQTIFKTYFKWALIMYLKSAKCPSTFFQNLFLSPLARTARVCHACTGAMGRAALVSSALARTRAAARDTHSLALCLAASLAPADSRHAASPSRSTIASVGHGNRTTPAFEP
jgi:hypothetical protein